MVPAAKFVSAGSRAFCTLRRGRLWTFIPLVLAMQCAYTDPAAATERLAAECRRSTATERQQLSMSINLLNKNMPRGTGPKTQPGLCSKRLAAVAGNLWYMSLDAATQAWAEELSCLELRKYYLERQCRCKEMGLAFEFDDAIVDESINHINKIYSAQKELRRRAVKNPMIKQYIDITSRIKECYSIQSVKTLESVAREIDKINLSNP